MDSTARQITIQHRRHQSWLELVELHTRIPQTGDFHDRVRAKAQLCTGRDRAQVYTWHITPLADYAPCASPSS